MVENKSHICKEGRIQQGLPGPRAETGNMTIMGQVHTVTSLGIILSYFFMPELRVPKTLAFFCKLAKSKKDLSHLLYQRRPWGIPSTSKKHKA